MLDLVIIGYSGHAYVAIDILRLEKYRIVGYCDQIKKDINPFELPYLGTEGDFDFAGKLAFVGIGDNNIRKIVMEKLRDRVEFAKPIHPTAVIANDSTIGTGSMVAANAVVNPFAKVGRGVIINSGAIVEHESVVGDYAHIAPGAALAGNVSVGALTFVGANAVVKQGMKIGNQVTIGAGAVIINDIPDNAVVVGNPGKIIKYNT